MKPYTILAYTWNEYDLMRKCWRYNNKHCRSKDDSRYAKKMFRVRAKRQLVNEINEL